MSWVRRRGYLVLSFLLCAVGATLFFSATSSLASSTVRCSAKVKARVVWRTSEVTVVADSSDEFTAKYYGCSARTGRWSRLDVWRHDSGFRVFRPVGRWVVSVAYSTLDYPSSVAAVVLTDVLTRRRFYVYESVWEPMNGDVVRVLLKRNGSLAFLTVTSPDVLYRCSIATCYGADRKGQPEQLDEGTIAVQSLRIDRSKIRWRNAAGPRAATLR